MKKMIIRADDVGFTDLCNIGTFEAIENGVVTSADVMLDSPGTEDALVRLREYPWISVGWHMHMWGAPALDPGQVPSLVEKDGEFAGRFRLDLAQAEDVVFEEAVMELRAQLDKCIRILGKAPDTGGGGRGNSPWGRACRQVSGEYGVVYNFATRESSDMRVVKKIEAAQKAGEEWAKYYSADPRPEVKADDKWLSRWFLLNTTIIRSIIYLREGDNIQIKIDFGWGVMP